MTESCREMKRRIAFRHFFIQIFIVTKDHFFHWRIRFLVDLGSISLIFFRAFFIWKRIMQLFLVTFQLCNFWRQNFVQNIDEIDSQDWFHQHLKSSFYVGRSQERKKTLMTWLSFLHFYDFFKEKMCVKYWWHQHIFVGNYFKSIIFLLLRRSFLLLKGIHFLHYNYLAWWNFTPVGQ